MSLSSLLKAASVDPEAVLAATEADDCPNNVTTQHAKVAAQLKLDRFDEALKEFSMYGSSLQQAAGFEYAYTLYKTGRLAEARSIAEQLDDMRGMHLLAQVSYRSEDFETAARIYRELWDSDLPASEESDLRVNMTAADAQLLWTGRGGLVAEHKVSREDMESFETVYNMACVSLAKGELTRGRMLLQRASDLCSASDIEDSEKTTELLPIRVQQLFVEASLGNAEAASQLAEEITSEELTDRATRKVAQINKLAVHARPANPFLTHRLFHSLAPVPALDKLFQVQEGLVRRNEIALDLLNFKFHGVVSAAQRQLKKYSMPTTDSHANSLSATDAAAQAQCQLGELGLKSILPLQEKRPFDIGLALTIVQLYMLTKNHGAAIKVMESLLERLEKTRIEGAQDVRFAPGVVGVLVSLYRIEGRKSHIRRELAKAASFWRHRSKPHPAFLRAVALGLLTSENSKDVEAGRSLFGDLMKEHQQDTAVNAGFVAAFAPTETSTSAAAARLRSVEKLTAGMDAAALDEAGVPTLKRGAPASPVLSRKRAAGEASKPAKKRVRISRRPKDMDPNKKPDPERWLPLRDRSTYRPKGKKNKQKQAGLTQGGFSKEAADSGAEGAKVEAKSSGVAGSGGAKSKKKGKKK